MKKEDKTYRQTLLDAWVNNRMEIDKSLFTLSVASAGFLLTQSEKISRLNEVYCWLISVLSFVSVALVIYSVFRSNASYIKLLLEKEGLSKKNNILERKIEKQEKLINFLDIAAVIMFAIGFLSSFYLSLIKILIF